MNAHHGVIHMLSLEWSQLLLLRCIHQGLWLHIVLGKTQLKNRSTKVAGVPAALSTQLAEQAIGSDSSRLEPDHTPPHYTHYHATSIFPQPVCKLSAFPQRALGKSCVVW